MHSDDDDESLAQNLDEITFCSAASALLPVPPVPVHHFSAALLSRGFTHTSFIAHSFWREHFCDVDDDCCDDLSR